MRSVYNKTHKPISRHIHYNQAKKISRISLKRNLSWSCRESRYHFYSPQNQRIISYVHTISRYLSCKARKSLHSFFLPCECFGFCALSEHNRIPCCLRAESRHSIFSISGHISYHSWYWLLVISKKKKKKTTANPASHPACQGGFSVSAISSEWFTYPI